jgi:hypothetical protein
MNRATAFLLTLALTCAAYAAEPFPLPFEPFTVKVPFNGREIALNVSGTAMATDITTALDVKADIVVSLADLRAQIGDIIRSKVNRDDDCGDRLDIHTVDLRAEPPVAMLDASAHYERWGCGFGIKTVIVKQDGDIRIRLIPVVANDTINVDLDVVAVKANGLLGELLRDGVAGPLIVDQLRSLFPKTLTAGRFRDALPAAVRDVPADLSNVAIVDIKDGTPGIRGTLHMTLTGDKMLALLQMQKK